MNKLNVTILLMVVGVIYIASLFYYLSMPDGHVLSDRMFTGSTLAMIVSLVLALYVASKEK